MTKHILEVFVLERSSVTMTMTQHEFRCMSKQIQILFVPFIDNMKHLHIQQFKAEYSMEHECGPHSFPVLFILPPRVTKLVRPRSTYIYIETSCTECTLNALTK